MRDVTGRCPSCHAEGPVGQPCGERGCQRRGYHFIPADAFEKIRELPPARTDPRIGQCIGDYLVVDVLGAGGFGRVYLALQLPIGMKAALKVMERPETDPDLAESLARRFEGEASALAALTHPNIVRLLKYGVHEGVPYLVMEFVEGNRTLRAEMQTGALAPERPDPAVTVHVLRQVLNALDAAHQRGIVHRDVKPENVMIQEVAGDPWFVKVLDFGLAKFVQERTETSLMVGTPAYMAPEQITRKNIGPWTDLYAVGVLAFRLITGRLPFLGDSTQETYAKKLDPEYDPMSQAAGTDLSPLLAGFLRQAMARDPESRFRSAGEFLRAFDAVAPLIGASATTAPAFDAPTEASRTPAPARGPAGAIGNEAWLAEGAPAAGDAAAPPADARARRRRRDSEGGHSLTEEVRRVGDEVFAQVASPSAAWPTTVSSRNPTVSELRPRRSWLGELLFVLGLVLALGAAMYLYEYGATLAPVARWLGRAEASLEAATETAPATPAARTPAPAPAPGSAATAAGSGAAPGVPAGTAAPTDAARQRIAPVHLVSTPPGAQVTNRDTGDELGRTPVDLLVPPGGALHLRLRRDGYREQEVTLTHDDVSRSPEWPVSLVRRR